MKQLTDPQMALVLSRADTWLPGIAVGHVPIAVGSIPNAPILAASCNPLTGETHLYDLTTGAFLGAAPLSGAISNAAFVTSKCMAGYVWEEHIAMLPVRARKAYHLLTVHLTIDRDPTRGLQRARELLGEPAPSRPRPAQRQRTHRNAPCRCGSARKSKQCCGP
jgi:hypothetical protein